MWPLLRSCRALSDAAEAKCGDIDRDERQHRDKTASRHRQYASAFESTECQLECTALDLHISDNHCDVDTFVLLVLSVSVLCCCDEILSRYNTYGIDYRIEFVILNFIFISIDNDERSSRIQYSNYFSWYSTIGLIVMTSIFVSRMLRA